jgi:hypothetical protein
MVAFHFKHCAEDCHAVNGVPHREEAKMATYAQIAAWIRHEFGFVAQTCWIADVKAQHGLTRSQAPNRIDPTCRAKPCPDSKRAAIEKALTHFGMTKPKKRFWC